MWSHKVLALVVVLFALLWPRYSWTEETFFFDEHLFHDVPGDCRISTSRDTPIAQEQLTLSWLTLEEDTEEGVLARFGKTPSLPGGEYRFYHCYEDAESGAVTVLSGVRPDVFQVTLADSKQRLAKGTVCRRVPQGAFNTATKGGLRLGLRRAEVKALLGEPLRETPERLYYSTTVRIPMSAEDRAYFSKTLPGFRDEDAYFDSLRAITVRLNKGRVYSFTLRKTTSW